MRNILLIFLLLISSLSNGQLDKLNLTNALVIGQLDKTEDRFSIEVNVTELLSNNGIKSMPSLNVLKLGNDPDLLASDSIVTLLKSKGIDTYIIIFVRGYDKKFKVTERKDDLPTVLNTGSLFPIYREEVTSVSFEFLFYRNGQMLAGDIIKCNNVSNRDNVLKKLRKKLNKKIKKSWK